MEIDILDDITEKGKKKSSIKKSGKYKADANNILVARLMNSNINWDKIGEKNKFFKMAQIYDENMEKFDSSTTAVKKTIANKEERTLESTNVDWDRFFNIPVVVKYIEDKRLEQRRLDVINAQKILRDQDSDKDDINRAKVIMSMNKDLIGEEVQTGQNEGLIRTHVSLSAIDEHINREKELHQK